MRPSSSTTSTISIVECSGRGARERGGVIAVEKKEGLERREENRREKRKRPKASSLMFITHPFCWGVHAWQKF